MTRPSAARLVGLVVVLGGGFSDPAGAGAQQSRVPVGPAQPLVGPGSSEYAHERVVQSRHGRDGRGFFLMQPAVPRPVRAPVVVFVHGYSITNPRNYAGWLTHLARKGNTVIYPIYQSGFSATEEDFAANALAAVVDAFGQLHVPGQIRPEGDHFFVIGHSLGAAIAVYIAGAAQSYGLPAVDALLLANAGDSGFAGLQILDRANLSQIPAETLLLAVSGSDDRLVNHKTAMAIFENTPQIPISNKVLLQLYSDYNGVPPLLADHAAAGSWHSRPRIHDVRERTSRINALDYYGYWKWFDALKDMVISGTHGEYAYGGTPEQTFMGVWSDGTPVQPAEVLWP